MSEKNTSIILSGSARHDGDTEALVKQIQGFTAWPHIELNQFSIGHFDYAYENQGDDFLPLIKKLIDQYDRWILVTPVYWYAMSGAMKVFFDRITDLLTEHKDLGRMLRGKSMAVVTVSHGNNLGDTFWLPFSETAHYLGMHFLGGLHTSVHAIESDALQDFIEKLNE